MYITRFFYIIYHLSLSIGMMAAVDVIICINKMINGACSTCMWCFSNFTLKYNGNVLTQIGIYSTEKYFNSTSFVIFFYFLYLLMQIGSLKSSIKRNPFFPICCHSQLLKNSLNYFLHQ